MGSIWLPTMAGGLQEGSATIGPTLRLHSRRIALNWSKRHVLVECERQRWYCSVCNCCISRGNRGQIFTHRCIVGDGHAKSVEPGENGVGSLPLRRATIVAMASSVNSMASSSGLMGFPYSPRIIARRVFSRSLDDEKDESDDHS